VRDIIRWWDARHVGAVGLVTWLVVWIAGSAAVQPGVDDFEEPIVMLFGPLLYGIAANVCYTFGWIVDVAAYRGSPRQWLYTLGLPYTIYIGRKLGPG
jgi:hypothetical protein